MELRALLEEMIRRSASDLHLVVGVPPVLRENGNLLALGPGGGEAEPNSYPILTPDDLRDLVTQIHTLMPDWDGKDITLLRIEGIYFRVAVLSDVGVPAICVRLCPRHAPRMVDLFGESYPLYDMIKQRRGLIIVAGPVGSGKSTTLMSMIEEINCSRSERITVIGLEYPMESKMSLVTQHFLGIDYEDMGDVIKRVPPMDPDVVVVLDPQDEASILGALRLAAFGNLVFMTVYANTTSEAIEAIMLMAPGYTGLARKYLADSLHAVVAQRLIRRSPEQGRVPVHEILMATPLVKERIRNGETDFGGVIKAGRGEGMLSADDSLLDLLASGRISYQTAYDNMQDLRLLPEAG